MQIVIQTTHGTFLVQPEKEADLIAWLERNAVKAGQRTLKEQSGDQYNGQQLLTEQTYGNFNMKHILGNNSKSTLTNIQEGDCQPNAVDLRLDKVFRILPNVFELTNETKKHRGSEEVLPDAEGFFNLEIGSYEVVMENIVNVGDGESGWTITRSTLNRNGVFITSGLYDSGYHGVMAGCMHVNVGPMRIKKGTRVAQYLSFDSEMLHAYNGSYGFGADGKPKADEQKYHG